MDWLAFVDCSTVRIEPARLNADMSLPLIKIIRSGLAVVLGLWVAGAGCLLGCEGMMTTAASERDGVAHHATGDLSLVVSGEACASAKSHDCCAKQKQHAQPKTQTGKEQAGTLIETGPSSSDMSACPLAMSRTDVAAKISGGETSSAISVVNPNLPNQNLLEQTAPLVRQVRLPNRGHTYLRCCSFLI
jgi:hypothetical protein